MVNLRRLALSGALTQPKRRYDWVTCIVWFMTLIGGAVFWLAVLYGIRLGVIALIGG
jgi:hypothetical protein